MFVTRLVSSQRSILGGLAVSVMALLLTVESAAAQHPTYVSPPAPPIGSSKMWPWNVQGYTQISPASRASAPANCRIEPASFQAPSPRQGTAWSSAKVVITRPEGAPVYVDIRGPDGQIRRVPLLGGREVIKLRQVIVHGGERATITVLASDQGK